MHVKDGYNILPKLNTGSLNKFTETSLEMEVSWRSLDFEFENVKDMALAMCIINYRLVRRHSCTGRKQAPRHTLYLLTKLSFCDSLICLKLSR